jgi:ribonucleotide monophosphatase NagD (HAD superfamily)
MSVETHGGMIFYCRLLLGGAPLIAIHCGRYYKRSDGLALGPGPFVRALEYASGCHSEVVGKPSPTFFQSALGDTDPAYAVMIGDVSLASHTVGGEIPKGS